MDAAPAAGAALPAPFLDAALALVGLAVGSFLNVVVHRLPRDESVVRPRSRCPACRAPIAARHNVPLLSWLLLRGRCASCRARISARYPAVEAATALFFVAVGRLDGATLALPFHLAFVAALVAVALIDLDFQIIPNEISLPGAVAGLALAALQGKIVAAVIGVAVGSGILWGIGALYMAVRRVEGMGGGDVKLAAMLGAFLGWKGMLLTIFLSSFAGAVAGIALMRLAGTGRQTRIPYGTFLAPAAICVLFAGDPVIAWYTGLIAR